MRRVFEVIMLILEGFLAAGSLFFAFAERGALPKILYVIACILLIPAVPLREKLEKKYRLKSFIIPAAGVAVLVAAVMLTPIH